MAKNKDKIISNQKANREKERSYLHFIARLYALFILGFFPLFVGMQGYDNIIHAKAVLFWAGSLVLMTAFALFYLAYRLGLKYNERPPMFWKTMSVADWGAAAFLICIIISYLLSKHKDIAFWGMKNRNDGLLTYLIMIMSYFIISRWYKASKLDFNIFAVSSSILCIIGFFQFYGYDFFKLFPYNRPPFADAKGNLYFSGFSIQYRSTLGNIDFVSAYVCMSIIAFGILFVKAKGKSKYLYLAASAMNFVLMIIAGADAGKVGLLGAMVLLIPYWIFTKQNLGKVFLLTSVWGFCYTIHHWIMINIIMPSWGKDRPRNDIYLKSSYPVLPLKIILTLSIVALILGLISLFLKTTAWPKEKNMQIIGVILLCGGIACSIVGVEIIGSKLPKTNIIYQAREILHGNMEDDFGSRRGYIWRKALEHFDNDPLFGTGSDTFIYAFGKENQAEAVKLHGVKYDKAHNDFIQILLCNGIFAIVAYFVFVVGLIVASIKSAFRDSVAFVTLGVVLAYLIQSFFGLDTLVVTPIFWLMLGLLRSRQKFDTLTETVY